MEKVQYSMTVKTRIIKGNYEARQISYSKNGVAIFNDGEFVRTENTIQDARKFMHSLVI